MPSFPKKIRIGSRGSKLALAQAESIRYLLLAASPEISISIQTIQTSGDRFRGKDLASAGGKGLFVKEIEEALLKNEIDLAVHSLKDLPGFLPEGLTLCCFPKREDPRDCFVSLKFSSLEQLPKGAKIGTTSPRRKAQFFSIRPDLRVEAIRGNVETRLKKLESGNFDALILATAGLKRLKKEDVIRQYFEPDFLIPAVGQGVLGIETRKKDVELATFLKETLEDPSTAIAARAERAFLQECGGDCYTPLAGYAWIEKGTLQMLGGLGTLDGEKFFRSRKSGSKDQPEKLGEALAKEILNALSFNKTA